MAIVKTDETVVHPEGKILLRNGNIIEAFAKADPEPVPVDTGLKLDTSGVYLQIGRGKKCSVKQSDREMEDADRRKAEYQRFLNLFKNNAIALYHRKEEIYADSRMFLAPVDVGCNLAYFGTSHLGRATLGVWLEWWDALQVSRQDEKGNERLVYFFAGSPLSGCNKCKVIFPSGKDTRISFGSFGPLWGTFMQINSRYFGLGQKYQAYTLEEVLDKLGLTPAVPENKPSLDERLRRLLSFPII